MIDYLDLDDLLKAAETSLGRLPEVGDWGLMESALGRPQATVFGADAYATLAEKAAALLHSLATTQSLIDGNKRMAWAATRLFYILNDRDLSYDEDDAFHFVMAIAEHETTDVAKIAEQLRIWEIPPRA